MRKAEIQKTAAELRKEYMREWRKKNRAKNREYQRTYWERRAKEQLELQANTQK